MTWHPRTLTWSILPILLLVQAVMCGLLVYQGADALQDMANEQTRARLKSLSVELNAALVAPLLERDYATLQEIATELTTAGDLAYLAIYDASGRRLVMAGDPAGIRRAVEQALAEHDGPVFDTRLSLHQGSVRLGLKTTESRLILWQLLQRTGPAVLLSMLLSTAWLALVTVWLARRLRRLGQVASALGDGLLTERAPEQGRDEIACLGQAFNRMAAAVQAADERWARSQHFTESLLMAIPTPVFYKDRQGRYLGCNEAFARVTGRNRFEIRGRTADELWPEGLAALHQQHDAALLRGDGPQAYPGILTDQHGLPRQVVFSKDVYVDDLGQIAGIIGAWSDVSEQLAAESRLRLLAGVFQHSREGIVIADAQGRIIDVNQALCKISGYDREEVLGAPPQRFYSGRHEPAFYQQIHDTLCQKGYWQGEVWNRRKDGSLYPVLLSLSAIRDEQGKTRHYIGVFADISELKAQEARLDRMAHHDPLTQLPNRVLLAERMRQATGEARERGEMLAICFMDLDGFKQVNDQYGHDVGDQLLVQVAERLRAVLRGGDTVARLGGDEFALLLARLPDTSACHASLQRVLETVAKPYRIGDSQLQISASIGVSLCPQEEDDPDTLLRHADQAMYKAKEQGRNGYQIFDAEYDRRRRSRKQSHDRLREAMKAGELRLYYQPKVDMRAGRVVGAEALLRWQHPEQGVLAPGAFLGDIEHSELDLQLGEWVIHEALAQMQAWRGEGLILPVSVNISAHQLQQADFARHLAAILAGYPDVARGMLEIEVLESAALSDIPKASRLMRDCQAMGVRFSLDDFGTGYSSLLYLKRLPADKLKIDQSFVRGMHAGVDDLAIVQGIIGLSGAFNRELVAEGVETVEHGCLLLQLGCDVAQGYAIARPMPAANLPGWVAQWRGFPAWEQAGRLRWGQDDITLFSLSLACRQALEAVMVGEVHVPGDDWERGAVLALQQWLMQTGSLRYGHQPGYGMLLPLLAAVLPLADRLWHAGSRDEGACMAEGIQQLGHMREQIDGLVKGLLGARPAHADAHFAI